MLYLWRKQTSEERNRKRLIALIGYTFAVCYCVCSVGGIDRFSTTRSSRDDRNVKDKGSSRLKHAELKSQRLSHVRFLSFWWFDLSSYFRVKTLLAVPVPTVFSVEPSRRTVILDDLSSLSLPLLFYRFHYRWQGRTPRAPESIVRDIFHGINRVNPRQSIYHDGQRVRCV